MPQPPEVTILLALYNGAVHLQDQLDSFRAQTHANWALLVSDDGSKDDSPAIIRRFAASTPAHPVVLLDGPRMGFAQNFLHLLRAAGPVTPFVALSDQDDVWLPTKLARGLAALQSVPDGQPALYCSHWTICNDDLTRRTARAPFPRRPSFPNALVQNVASGNSIMLNRAALSLVQAASSDSSSIYCHDWWIYQIVTGAGGQAIYDPEPQVLYRQHDSNLIGSNHSARASLSRLRLVLEGRFQGWNDRNITALRASAHHLTAENRALLERFAHARAAPLFRRLRGMRDCGIYRQRFMGNLGLWVAAVLGRI